MKMSITQNRDQFYLPLAILMAGALCLLRFSTIPVGTFFDDANYLILAEGLAAGAGYRLVNFPAMPTEQAFPPGWPLLLAPMVGLFPGNLFVPKLLTLLFSLGSIPLADRLFKDRLDSLPRLLFLLFIALNPLFVGAAGTVMSEPAYLFFSLLTLLLLNRFLDQNQSYWAAAVILALAFFSMVVRTAGITLVLAVIILLIPRQRWRTVAIWGGGAAIVGGLAIFLLPRFFEDIFLFSPLYLGHVEYLAGEFGSYLRFWNHLGGFDWPSIGNLIVPIFDLNLTFIPLFDVIKSFAPLLLVALVLGGFVLSIWEIADLRPTELYFLFFLALFYLWTAYINEVQQRQLVPVIPFLSFYLIQSLYWMGKKLNLQKLAPIICGLILVTLLGRNVHAWLNPVSETVINYELGGTWLRENSDPDIVYAVNYPRPSYLYSRRSTEYLPAGLGNAAFEAYVAERQIKYLLIQPDLADWDTGELQIRPEIARRLLPYLEENRDKYKLVFEDEAAQISIYEIIAE